MTQATPMASAGQTDDLTPQERLVISRKALVRNMTSNDRERREAKMAAKAHEVGETSKPSGGNWALLKRGLSSWWYHHPANLAIDVAKPIIGRYAREHPTKLIGIAAVVGAATVFLKPWRLISLGGIAVAAMKSSDLTNIVMSMLFQSSQSSQQSQNSKESSQHE